MYSECIQITRQFAFCPNAFRVDLYKGCDFGCKYCFANMDWSHTEEHKKNNWDVGDIKKIKRIFHTALETDKESKDILVELIRHHVPIHCGGMSDPFQKREWELGLTKELIELSVLYNYPVQFSTKTSTLPASYRRLLNPDIHLFQSSIIGWNLPYIKRWECNTPTAQERLDFVQSLKQDGFWVGVRIQPIIDIEECVQLCEHIENVDYVTLEHFKSIYDVHSTTDAFFKLAGNKEDFVCEGGKIQVRRDIKIRNIKQLQAILNDKDIKVGVGDNDLHYMSQSNCCCGIDTAGEAFKDYLKYNLTYMSKAGVPEDTFIPQCNPRKHINDQKYGLKIDCKQYATDYVINHLDYLGDKRPEVEKELCGISKNSLF